MSKKEEMRRQRKATERRNRIIIIIAIVVLAVAVVGIIISSQAANKVQIVEITPQAYPQANGLSMGDPNAPVKVDIYSDFQCPYCRKLAQEVEPTIIEKYVSTGKVYLTYHVFNVVGQESINASLAAYCANDQGRFWQYHDILFANWTGENVGDFTDIKLKAYAKSIGLDESAFNQCYDNKTFNAQVQADQDAGNAIPLKYTPSVFVNGTLDESGDYLATIEASLVPTEGK